MGVKTNTTAAKVQVQVCGLKSNPIIVKTQMKINSLSPPSLTIHYNIMSHWTL